MNKVFLAFAIIFVFAACQNNSKKNLETNKVMLTDTSGIYSNSLSSDTGIAEKTGAKPKSYNLPSNGSDNSGKVVNEKSTSATTTTSGNENNATTTSTKTKKKGWSNKAKDAVIGGAVGAVGGAIISKHKGTGAVVGGVVGAAGGYVIGSKKDKKEKK